MAARRLANPGATHMAFIGAGVQARSHLELFAALFPLREISVFGRGQSNIDHLCSMAREMGLKARACDTARGAVEAADLIVSSVTLDYNIDPFVDARWLKSNAFAAITDLALPWIADSLNNFDSIHIDDSDQEAASPKKLVSPALVTGDLRDLVAHAGEIPGGNSARRAFVFRGIAVGDFALARLAWNKALKGGKVGFTW